MLPLSSKSPRGGRNAAESHESARVGTPLPDTLGMAWKAEGKFWRKQPNDVMMSWWPQTTKFFPLVFIAVLSGPVIAFHKKSKWQERKKLTFTLDLQTADDLPPVALSCFVCASQQIHYLWILRKWTPRRDKCVLLLWEDVSLFLFAVGGTWKRREVSRLFFQPK